MAVGDLYGDNALLQPKSIQDFNNEYLTSQAKRQTVQQNALALQEGQMKLQQSQNALAQQTGLQQAIQSGQYDPRNPAHQAALLTQFPAAAPALLKTLQDTDTSAALASKDRGAGVASQADAQTKQYGLLKGATSVISANPTPDVVDKVLTQYSQLTGQPVDTTRALFAQAGNDPAKIKQIADGFGITADQHMQDQTTQRGQDTVLQGHKIQAGATVQAANIGANASMSNNANTIKKDYAVAGMNPDGSMAGGLESEAQLIAAGKIAPPSGMAATRPATAMLMKRVSEINPDYDATTYGAKVAAAKGFTSGQQGNALRSISTADDHLAQLDSLGDALNNGNIKILNSIGNAFGVQTGAAPAQVFNAVKNVVGQEVVKAIVAGGGSAGERDEAAKAFATDSSPAQLKQTIAAYRSVMGAQKSNLLEQRRAAGLPDSTLPNYAPPGGAPASSGGWKYIGPAK